MSHLQADENRRLQADVRSYQDRQQSQVNTIHQLQKQLQEKDDQLSITTSDKVRFKELSENYMQEVARLEA